MLPRDITIGKILFVITAMFIVPKCNEAKLFFVINVLVFFVLDVNHMLIVTKRFQKSGKKHDTVGYFATFFASVSFLSFCH